MEDRGAAPLLLALLRHFETLDFDPIEQILHDDAVFEFPFSAQGALLEGKAAIMDYLRTAMPSFVRHMRFTILAEHKCGDPAWAIAEYSSEAETVTGGRYANRYVGLVRAMGGRILIFREYFNPLAVIEAIGGDVPSTG